MRHLHYLLNQAGDDGLIGFGLWDWAGPFDPPEPAPTPLKFTDTLLTIKFVKIARLAAKLAKDQNQSANLAEMEAKLTETFKHAFLNQDGTCKVHEQTAVAMLIYHEVHNGLAPLAAQLVQTVRDHDYHHYCGMVGLRHLYEALDRCGRPDIGYRILTASGYPSYRAWIDQDATTLWETWQPGSSKNHHMYSDFMSWLIKSLVGIRPTFDAPGFTEVDFCPSFIPQLDWCSGSCDTVRGTIELEWRRHGQMIDVTISLPTGVKGRFHENKIEADTHHFQVPAPIFAD
jgi:alpha-L-rhamnosidase